MNRVRIAWIILMGLSAGLSYNAMAGEALQPMQAYTVKEGNHIAVLYYTAIAGGYQVVTTWIAGTHNGVLTRNTIYLTPGQHSTLSLLPAGLPARLDLHGEAHNVAITVDHVAQVACANTNVAQTAKNRPPLQKSTQSSQAATVVAGGSLIRLRP